MSRPTSKPPPPPEAKPTPPEPEHGIPLNLEQTVNNQPTTLRLPAEHLKWAEAMAAASRRSLSAFLRGLLEDYSDWFGTAPSAVNLIEADRRAMGMTRRAYYQHVMLRRYEDLRAKGPGFEAKAFLAGARAPREAK
jgi:hypothetical protein